MDINEVLAGPGYRASSMGRRNQPQGAAEMLHIQMVAFEDGDYDAGGAYWGGGHGTQPLYCAYSDDKTENEEPIMIFVRADNQTEAKALVLEELEPGEWQFFGDKNKYRI